MITLIMLALGFCLAAVQAPAQTNVGAAAGTASTIPTVAIALADDVPDVRGVWNGEISSNLGRSVIQMQLEQEQDRVWGTYRIQPFMGSNTRPEDDLKLEGKIGGNTLSVTQTSPGVAPRSFTATVDGQHMQGFAVNLKSNVRSTFSADRRSSR